ncbi:hypothetical protein NEDG_00628 [Nematocida displodere]|uniref:Uncharacterized protein n=1 Tax=Nematocida displodere TaxID=1805483 RepID=A0A177EC20_9MICR|nr:hypothetical protein NEDG_00628 [Nematocida displodere]
MQMIKYLFQRKKEVSVQPESLEKDRSEKQSSEVEDSLSPVFTLDEMASATYLKKKEEAECWATLPDLGSDSLPESYSTEEVDVPQPGIPEPELVSAHLPPPEEACGRSSEPETLVAVPEVGPAPVPDAETETEEHNPLFRKSAADFDESDDSEIVFSDPQTTLTKKTECTTVSAQKPTNKQKAQTKTKTQTKTQKKKKARQLGAKKASSRFVVVRMARAVARQVLCVKNILFSKVSLFLGIAPLVMMQANSARVKGVWASALVRSFFEEKCSKQAALPLFVSAVGSLLLLSFLLAAVAAVNVTVCKTPGKRYLTPDNGCNTLLAATDLLNITTLLPFALGLAQTLLQVVFSRVNTPAALFTACEVLYMAFVAHTGYLLVEKWRKVGPGLSSLGPWHALGVLSWQALLLGAGILQCHLFRVFLNNAQTFYYHPRLFTAAISQWKAFL